MNCGITDPYLHDYSRKDKHGIFSAFAYAIRNNELGRTAKTTLYRGTESATIDNVPKTFREASLDEPLLESNGKKYLKLQRRLKGYVDLDPATTTIIS